MLMLIKCSEVRARIPASQLQTDLWTAFPFIKTTFFMSVGV